MTQHSQDWNRGSTSKAFTDAARQAQSQPYEKPVPFSLRLTREERAQLHAQAGDQPLGAYIRHQLLGDKAQKRRRTRRPGVDHQKLALVLAELGRSRLASNLNQLAKATNMGTLDVSADLEQELREACQSIAAMREKLVSALGVKVESGK